MKICFVLPKTEKKAIGGFIIVYEYANRLSQRGHDVSILYLNTNYLKHYHAPKFVKKFYFDMLTKIEPRWFGLDTKVKKISDYSAKMAKDVCENSEVAVATAVTTADYVADRFITSNKVYMIQGRETWLESEEDVDRTYRLGMRNMVISHWLKDIVETISGKESFLIPNPIDLERYKVMNPIENRSKYSIGCLYNPNPNKGFDNALKVMTKLKAEFPEMGGVIFGWYDRPEYIPEWVKYVKKATQGETIDIYNNISVFLCSSINEGYGLTGLEAMACGCALCSTDYRAVYEYAEDGVNCLLSPVADIDAQVKNVSRLFKDDELRVRLASTATETVKSFSWDIAVDRFMTLIE